MALSEAELQRRIARDYYNSPLTTEELNRKYRRTGTSAVAIAGQFEFRGFPKEREYCVISVERSQMDAARELLRNGKIEHYIPPRYEITEFYESKMNEEIEGISPADFADNADNN